MSDETPEQALIDYLDAEAEHEIECAQELTELGKDLRRHETTARRIARENAELRSEIARLRAERDEAFRRRDQWREKAEGYDEVRLALREKVGAPWPPNMSRIMWAGIAADEKKRADDAESEIARLRAQLDTTPAEAARVPESPTPKQLHSACLSRDHSYGLMDGEQRERIEFQAREWWRCISRAIADGGTND